jgi:hypothetical protein
MGVRGRPRSARTTAVAAFATVLLAAPAAAGPPPDRAAQKWATVCERAHGEVFANPDALDCLGTMTSPLTDSGLTALERLCTGPLDGTYDYRVTFTEHAYCFLPAA